MSIEEKISIITESFNTLRAKGIVKTQGEFADLLNISERSLSAAKHGKDGYCTDNLVEKIKALMNEYQRNISINHSPHSNVATGNGHISLVTTPQEDIAPDDQEMIPVIPINLYKESDVNILEYIQDDDNEVQMTPAVQQFPKTDAIYSVQTMAMYPHLHQGDLLALKVVKRSAPIINGEMYAIDTIDNGILIRFAYDRGDYIEMRASEKADRFESFNIYKKDIFNIFRVVGMIRTNI